MAQQTVTHCDECDRTTLDPSKWFKAVTDHSFYHVHPWKDFRGVDLCSPECVKANCGRWMEKQRLAERAAACA